jgi:hypothetical protein
VGRLESRNIHGFIRRLRRRETPLLIIKPGEFVGISSARSDMMRFYPILSAAGFTATQASELGWEMGCPARV